MKLISNGYDTVTNRLIHTAALSQALILEKDLLTHAKTMLERFEAQAHQISQMAVKLELDESDMTTVAVRLKEVLDNYLKPLRMHVYAVNRYGEETLRFAVAYILAAADAELRCLRFTMDVTSDSVLPKAA